tara:strand:+ start:1385 stop:1876 length:492 start_codon:yes stop_codon:yes gene_type:complete
MKLQSSELDIVSNCLLCEEHSLHLIKDGIDTQQCINCGYATSSRFKLIDKENLKKHEEYKKLPNDMKEWCKVSNNFIWIPSFITLPIGMLFPFNDITEKGTTMRWGFAKLVDIPKEEQDQYPVEDNDGAFYEKKYDTDNPEIHDTFLEALHQLNELIKNNQPS